jgi:hypothetical protein
MVGGMNLIPLKLTLFINFALAFQCVIEWQRLPLWFASGAGPECAAQTFLQDSHFVTVSDNVGKDLPCARFVDGRIRSPLHIFIGISASSLTSTKRTRI